MVQSTKGSYDEDGDGDGDGDKCPFSPRNIISRVQSNKEKIKVSDLKSDLITDMQRVRVTDTDSEDESTVDSGNIDSDFETNSLMPQTSSSSSHLLLSPATPPATPPGDFIDTAAMDSCDDFANEKQKCVNSFIQLPYARYSRWRPKMHKLAMQDMQDIACASEEFKSSPNSHVTTSSPLTTNSTDCYHQRSFSYHPVVSSSNSLESMATETCINLIKEVDMENEHKIFDGKVAKAPSTWKRIKKYVGHHVGAGSGFVQGVSSIRSHHRWKSM